MKYMKCVHYMQYDINEFTPIYIQIHEFLVPINITYKDTHPPSTHLSLIYALIIDPHNNQLPASMIAQLVEHCTSIAEVRV